MRNIHKILLGVFCGGVLLTGIGTGITLAEFSSLAYAGERTVGGEQMETVELEEKIDPEKGVWRVEDHYPGAFALAIETDESVPENTVRLRVTYNAAQITPRFSAEVYTNEYWDEDGEYVTEKVPVLELFCDWKDQDDMKLFMEVKDQFLADLKEGKVSSYQSPTYVEDVVLLINPANENDVELY